jgi:iron complex transport system ATP-binding protein
MEASNSAACPVLRFADVHVRLGDRDVLRGVDLDLHRGEVLGLLGPNGAGKTTLLRLAVRALACDAGRVELEGQDVKTLPRRSLARRLAVVPQDLHVPFPFTVGEIVLMGRAPHQGLLGFESTADVARARDALERLRVEHLADRVITELSGGERQLVLFARALAQDADVLLLDEPTAHLDLRHRIDVLVAVRELAREGRAALVVSHDLGLAARACDRLAVLADGELVAEGAPGAVIEPSLLDRVFGIDAQVIPGPDGAPLIVPSLGPVGAGTS